MPELAPWLQINPLAGVPMYLQGFGQGASVGESRRRSEERAYEADLQAAAQQERNEILREARQIQAQEFAENLKLKQEQAQRAAKMAAIRLEGQQGLERDLQSGMTFQEAFPRHAPKLLFEEPVGLAQIFRQLQPAKDVVPREATIGGRNVIYNPATGAFETNDPVSTQRIDEGLAPGRYQRGNQVFTVPEPKPIKPDFTPKQRIDIEVKRAELMKQNELLPNPATSNLVQTLERALQNAQSQNIGANAPTRPESIPLPLPSKKEDLIKGQPYITRRGVAVWDGENFTTP